VNDESWIPVPVVRQRQSFAHFPQLSTLYHASPLTIHCSFVFRIRRCQSLQCSGSAEAATRIARSFARNDDGFDVATRAYAHDAQSNAHGALQGMSFSSHVHLKLFSNIYVLVTDAQCSYLSFFSPQVPTIRNSSALKPPCTKTAHS
jgi:hypothetical protein